MRSKQARLVFSVELLCSNLSDIPSYVNVNTTRTDKDHVKEKNHCLVWSSAIRKEKHAPLSQSCKCEYILKDIFVGQNKKKKEP